MFTGIIEEIGEIRAMVFGAQSIKLTIGAKKILADLTIGDSIAVNGICLTVTSYTDRAFTADVMPETVRVTSLAQFKSGDRVNLERALTLNRRLGGHIVSGHVDGLGKIIRMDRDDTAIFIQVQVAEALAKYIIPKGSIAMDGISITVASCDRNNFAVSVIPHTAAATTLGLKKIGDVINIENDMIGKYIERLLHFSAERQELPQTKLTMDFLKNNGF